MNFPQNIIIGYREKMSREVLKQFRKSGKYTFEEISKMIETDIPTIRIWRDMGIFSKDKTEVHRLKTHNDNGRHYVTGRDLIEFLSKKEP